MENEQPISQKEAYQWFASLIENVKAQAPLDKVYLNSKRWIGELKTNSWIRIDWLDDAITKKIIFIAMATIRITFNKPTGYEQNETVFFRKYECREK